MAQDLKKLIDNLNDLIALDYDAVHAYEAAIKRIEDGAISEQLRVFQSDHERHIRDLSKAVVDLGGEPRERPDAKGFFLKAFTAVTSMMGDRAALTAMRSNETLTNRAYDRALEDVWPPTLRQLIERNRDDERRHLAFVEEALRELRPMEAERT